MLFTQSMTPIVVALITYILFIFLGESLNPFKSPRGQLRFRWRFARAVALIFFVCAFVVLFLKLELQLSVLEASALLGALCVVLSIYPAIKYYRAIKVETGKNVEAPVVTPEPASEPVEKAATTTAQIVAIQESIDNPIDNLPALSMSELPMERTAISIIADEPKSTIESENAVLISEERKLELSLVESEKLDDFDPLDHTIAEADFHIEEFSPSEEFDVAKPIMASEDNSLLLDDIEEDNDELVIDVEVNESNALLLEKIAIQEAKIRKITHSNESLAQAREALVDEVAELKYEVKKRGTIARKSIAQRNEALEMKDRALALATMEQKKRKLTEVRARKALMKMRASLQLLSDQSAQQQRQN